MMAYLITHDQSWPARPIMSGKAKVLPIFADTLN